MCRKVVLPSLLSVLVGTAGCSGVPDGVLDKDEMASLIADIHKGEAAIDLSNGRMMSDSMRQTVRQSVYDAHGVTVADVDSSLRYYGHHIEDYLEVYDMAIADLQRQLDSADAVTVISNAVTAEGDSVDIWPYSRRVLLTPSSPAGMITFEVERDDTWGEGDTYIWGFKVINTEAEVNVRMLADYDDGTIEWIDAVSAADNRWVTASFTLDTVSRPLRIYGIAEFAGTRNGYVYIDSIMLRRMHPDNSNRTIRYRYKHFKP